MASYTLTSKDGKSYTVTADTPEKAKAALDKLHAQQPAGQNAEIGAMLPDTPLLSKTQRDYNELPTWQKPVQAADDLATIFGDTVTLGLVAKGMDKLFGGDTRKKLVETARERAGSAAVPVDIAGMIAVPGSGLTTAGRVGTKLLPRVAAGTGEGAVVGGLSAYGHDQDVTMGALLGGGLGCTAEAVGAGVSAIAPYITRYGKTYGQKAADKLAKLLEKTSIANQAELSKALDDIGGDALVADVMGTTGVAEGRAAANISPEAESLVERVMGGRAGGQNERVASSYETAAGLPVGGRKTVDQLSEETYKAAQPAINAAYDTARAAGHDIPVEPFTSIIATPMGKEAYDSAAKSILNKRSTDPANINVSSLMDEMQRRLGDVGQSAKQSGERAKSADAFALQSEVKRLIDELTPEYSAARKARRDLGRKEEAIDLGQRTASGRIEPSAPAEALAVKPDARQVLQQSHALAQVENLLNAGTTPGVVSKLQRPLAQEARASIYGPGAASIEQGLKAENTYAKTAKGLLGNSTTAKQLLKQAGAGGGVGGILGALYGGDPMDIATGAASGAAADASPQGLIKIVQLLSKAGVLKSAQGRALPTAEILMGKKMPNKINAGELEKFMKKWLPGGLPRATTSVAAQLPSIGREKR